jgi:serine/threonine protein kinase
VDSELETHKQITDPGVVMGTVGYMSPKQVRGEEADHRADVFAFGLILYEMLSGKRAFTGDSAAEMMSAIWRDEPPELGATNAKISPALEKIVRRCLEKKPERRFHSAHDLGFALEALSTPSGSRLDPSATALPAATLSGDKSEWLKNAWLAWIAAAILVLGLLVSLPFTIAYLRRGAGGAGVPQVLRFHIAFPSEIEPVPTLVNGFAISPDGQVVAMAGVKNGLRMVFARRLESAETIEIPESGVNNWTEELKQFLAKGGVR